MSDGSFQEKTEKPTPKKRDEARRKGQVPRSQELNTAALILAGAVAVGPAANVMASGLADLLGTGLRTAGMTPVSVPGAADWLRSMAIATASIIAVPILSVAGIVGLVAAAQGRGVLSTEKLQMKPDHLSPAKNLKRVFSVRAVADLLKSILKVVVVVVAVFFAVPNLSYEILALPFGPLSSTAELTQRLAIRVFIATGMAYLVLAAADLAFQIWQHERGLRMSKEEIKREQKETEGDGFIKARMRSFGRSLTRNRMIQAVPNADVIITNPTHIAVALRYDPELAPAPTVLAMGQRKIAQRIKDIAREHDIPVFENKPLARALFKTAAVGDVIPAEFYAAVAEVLAFVFTRRAKQNPFNAARRVRA